VDRLAQRLDRVLQEGQWAQQQIQVAGDDSVANLLNRLQPLLAGGLGLDKMQRLQSLARNVEVKVQDCMALFGESLQGEGTDSGDACKGFFQTIVGFVRSLRDSLDQHKATAVPPATPVLVAIDPSRINNVSSSNNNKEGDLFNRFHKAQQASFEALTADFKRKLQVKLASSSEDAFKKHLLRIHR